MLTRRILTAGLGLSLLPQTVLARQTQPALPEPLFILDAKPDADDRLTVEVWLNGQGPFQFIVDSGAGRSVLSAAVAERLGLARGPNVLIHGISGAETYPTAQVATLVVGDARLIQASLPVLPNDRVGGDGLLGVDILEDRNVIMDFAGRRLEVRRSRVGLDRVQMPREVSVMADDRFGRLTVADCRVDGARALAFIDTGGGVSIGNMALSRAISTRRRRSLDDVRPARLLTASGEMSIGEFRVAPSLTLGAVRLTDLPMAFTDLHVFDVWGLKARPAVLLGVDVLRMFARVELDYGAGRIRFRVGDIRLPPTALSA